MIDQFQISEKLTGLVIFELDNKEFCADIKDISAILNPKETEKTSNELNQKKGIKLNDTLIPLIDLHKLLGLKYKKRSKDIRIILVDYDDKLFAFFVEKVKEIFTVSASFKNKMNFIPGTEKYLLGKLCYERREMLLPDFQKISELIP